MIMMVMIMVVVVEKLCAHADSECRIFSLLRLLGDSRILLIGFH